MKQIKFCSGHRLLGHEGKCANLHGHNYIAQIFVSGNQTDELGRIVDFSVINQLFKGWLDDNWDHGLLLWEQDKDAIKAIEVIAIPTNTARLAADAFRTFEWTFLADARDIQELAFGASVGGGEAHVVGEDEVRLAGKAVGFGEGALLAGVAAWLARLGGLGVELPCFAVLLEGLAVVVSKDSA